MSIEKVRESLLGIESDKKLLIIDNFIKVLTVMMDDNKKIDGVDGIDSSGETKTDHSNDTANEAETIKETLLELIGTITHTSMLCDGLTGANCSLSKEQYIDITSGAIPLIARALDEACQLAWNLECSIKDKKYENNF